MNRLPQTKPLGCPNCGEALDPTQRRCPHCGVDIGLATAFAELDFVRQQASEALQQTQAPPLEMLVPRLGERLVEQGLITAQDLKRALEYQQRHKRAGRSLLLGEALIELGLIDRPTLDRAITGQLLQYQEALRQANRTLEARVRERTAALRQALEKLSELNELKSNFIANISHELRTPMTHIRGYTELLLAGMLGPLNDEQQQALQTIHKASNRLEALIEDLIRYSLISRGELSLNPAPLRPEHLVRSVHNQLRAKAAEKQIHFTYQVADGLPDVRGDAEKLVWALYHLCDNAIKFTPDGGDVKLSAHADNNLVVFSVTDNGIGIPAERVEEIFEPFHQLDGSSTRRYGGAGLGLALVRRIIEAHGSVIQVQSKPGHGSRFSFALPAMAVDSEESL